MNQPRVLILLNPNAAWSRGIVRGLSAVAHERGWTLLNHHPTENVEWLLNAWTPSAVIVGADVDESTKSRLDPATLISVGVDRSAQRIASVCLDEAAIGQLAAAHLLATGVKHMAVFRRHDAPFALAREQAFVARVRAMGIHLAAGCSAVGDVPLDREDDPTAVLHWLRGLPTPCGIFACTDFWGKAAVLCARAVGRRIPEDFAILGVDNDVLQCEMVMPPLSSVVVPWREVGESAGELVRQLLAGEAIQDRRVVVSPLAVLARRSSALLAVDDELVAKAVHWIQENARGRVNLEMIANAVGSGRQRLERRFRRSLDRTIQDEIRRTRVEAARRLLETTDSELREIARGAGFTNATLLNLAFQRELGIAPGAYRRRMRQELLDVEAS